MQAVIVVAAKFLIYCAVLDDVPGNDQHPMRDRERRLLTTAFYGYTPKQRGQVAVLFTHHRPVYASPTRRFASEFFADTGFLCTSNRSVVCLHFRYCLATAQPNSPGDPHRETGSYPIRSRQESQRQL